VKPAALIDLLREFTAGGLATLIISHDVEDLMALCDEVARVHPADEEGQPSHVELTAAASLAERLLATPTAAPARTGGAA